MVDEILAQWARERPDLDSAPVGLVGRLSRLHALLDRGLKTHFATEGLEPWEYDVLATLRRNGAPHELTMGALLGQVMVTSGAITNRVDRLETRGLVARIPDPADRRSVRVKLTAEGLALVERVVVGHLANERRLLAGLTRAQQDQLADLLRELLISLGDQSTSEKES